MRRWNRVMALCLAAVLALALPGCQGVGLAGSVTPGGIPGGSEGTPEQEPPAAGQLADPAPVIPETLPPAAPLPGEDTLIPAVDGPAQADEPAPAEGDPFPEYGDPTPFETGDVPAVPRDEETTLLVALEGMEEEAPAVLHHSTLGYSIAYDAALTLSEWENGDSYAAPLEGAWLAVTTVGLDTEEEALEGLRLQNGVEGEAGLARFGARGYEAKTLCLEDGGFRVEWLVCRHNGTIWLVELAVSGPEAAEGWGARFQAMLDTLEFT